MIQRAKLLFCLLFVVLLVACAGVQMTHKDYMGWAWSIYNTQFEEYKRMVGLGGVPSTDLDSLTDEQKRKSEEAIAGLTEEQSTMLRLKKQEQALTLHDIKGALEEVIKKERERPPTPTGP